jgi:hypothetical protein
MKNLSDRTEMLIEDRAAFESYLSEIEETEEEFKQLWYDHYDGMIDNLLESCQEAFMNQLDRFINNSDFGSYDYICYDGMDEYHMLTELRKAITGKLANM